MNHQQLQAELDRLEVAIKCLNLDMHMVREKLSALPEPTADTSADWRPERYNPDSRYHYSICADFQLMRLSEAEVDYDVEMYESGNYFHTREAAESCATYLKAHLKLWQIAHKLNEGWVSDWDATRECKYYLSEDRILGPSAGVTYFRTHALAERAILWLTDEDKAALFGVKT